MASKRKKRRQREQEEREKLLADDAFLEHGSEGVAWFEKHGRKVLLGAGAVLMSVMWVQFMIVSSIRTKAERTSALNKAVMAYGEATDLRSSLSDDKPLKEKLAPVAEQLAKVRKDNPNTPVAVLAAAYEGEALRRMGKNKEALKAFSIYRSQVHKGTDPLLFMVLEGEGYAAEADGDDARAMAAYKKLAGQAFYKDFALKHQARLLEKSGDKAGAAKLYQEIVDMSPASPLKSFAQARLKAAE